MRKIEYSALREIDGPNQELNARKFFSILHNYLIDIDNIGGFFVETFQRKVKIFTIFSAS